MNIHWPSALLVPSPPADILQARDNSAQLAEHHYRLIYESTTWAGYAAEQ